VKRKVSPIVGTLGFSRRAKPKALLLALAEEFQLLNLFV